MHHPFPLLCYPAHVFMVGGGCGGRKRTILSAELAVSRVFERSLNLDQTRCTRGWGTGFSGVRFRLPVPVPQGNP